jgi:hypothetical protein
MEAAMPDVVAFPSTKPTRQQKRRILSAKTLNALTPPPTGSVDYFDDLTPGLSLRRTANDARHRRPVTAPSRDHNRQHAGQP